MSQSHDDAYASDDEETAAAAVASRCAAAKAQGNALFAAGSFDRAAHAYSLALRLSSGRGAEATTLLSNRSAAHAKLGRWQAALEDAERGVKMDGSSAKLLCRKGAALVGLGQAGEGVKAYLKAREVDPGYAGATEGLQLAKAAIRDAQARYNAMWG